MERTFRSDIVHAELSYKVVGDLFRVHTKLGNNLREEHYQRALSNAFKESNIAFVEQVHIPVKYKTNEIGKLFADFIIEDTIILEIKAVPRLTPRDYQQTLLYLATLNKELGILANFRPKALTFRRVLNSSFGNSV